MATKYESLSGRHRQFIDRQSMFFVATAARIGRVNVSPKGLDSLRVLGPNRVVWLNLTGSGNETAAHLLRDDRMTFMFCSFERTPLILRLYGRGTEVQPCRPGWTELAPLFPPKVGSRQIFDLEIDLVQDSCGFGVPLMKHIEERPLLVDWAMRKGREGVRDYHREKNQVSIDGFRTGLDVQP
jgi:hypothetical protein